MSLAEDIWLKTLPLLKSAMTDASYKAWIVDLKPIEIDENGALILLAPNIVKRDVLTRFYKEIIKNSVLEAGGQIASVSFVANDEDKAAPSSGNSKPGYAFISYSSKDMDLRNEVLASLKENGIATWSAPDDIPSGKQYYEQVNEAITECSCLVLILTEASQISLWVEKEVSYAIARGKPIVPVCKNQVALDDNMAFYLNQNQIFYISDFSSRSAAMTLFAKTVRETIIHYTSSAVDRRETAAVHKPSGFRALPETQGSDEPQAPKAYLGDKPYIFISYCHDNEKRVQKFIAALQKKYNVWFDEGVHYGHEWEVEIAAKLRDCSLFLFMITPESLESPNCMDELYHARKRSKPFVNIMVGDTFSILPEWFELRYGRYQMCKLYSFSSDDEAVRDLARKNEAFEKVKK